MVWWFQLSNVTASMEPRLFSRGMRTIPLRRDLHMAGFNGAATFQPRNAFARGKAYKEAESLQWSRDFSAAECSWELDFGITVETLQWSRDFSAAE